MDSAKRPFVLGITGAVSLVIVVGIRFVVMGQSRGLAVGLEGLVPGWLHLAWWIALAIVFAIFAAGVAMSIVAMAPDLSPRNR